MSSIASISPHNTADFELRPDATRPGGMALVDISGKNGYTTSDAASISEAGRILARQLATARDEMAAQKDAAGRYEAALNFGRDYERFITDNTNVVSAGGEKKYGEELRRTTEKTSTTYSTVSAQGTVVSVAYLPVEESRQDTKAQLYTAQITRKDGLQLNLALDDDIRVNDLEGGGLSIYYAASGITRTFDAQGNESISRGEAGALGSAGNDIIINRFSSKVDAGDGDDVIFNLADNTEILGGAGNDKILLTGRKTNGLTIDGGAGDDTIVGDEVGNSVIRMEEGSDSLITASIKGANISASGNNFIKTVHAEDISLTSRNGALNADIKRIYKGNLDIERIGDNFSVDGFQNVNAVFGDGDMTLTTGGIGDSNFAFGKGDLTWNMRGGIGQSNIAFGKGDLTLNARGISYSTITHTEGSSTINTSGGLDNSHIILGNEQAVDQDGKQINNIINSSSINRTVIDSYGNLNIITGGNDGSIINANNGDAHITLDSSHFSAINTGSGNDTIIARSLHGVSLSTGSGNDTIIADTLFEANINAGDGDDVIRVNKAAHYSYVNAGSGNNTINVGDLNSTSISAGNGNNTIHIGQNYGNSSLNMGSGNNTYVTDAAKQLAAQKPAPLEAKNSVDTDALLMDALFGTEGKNARNATASTTPDFKRRMLQKAAAAYAGRL